MRAKALLPVTLVRSPMLTNSAPAALMPGPACLMVGNPVMAMPSSRPAVASCGSVATTASPMRMATPTARMSMINRCRMRLTMGTCVTTSSTWSTISATSAFLASGEWLAVMATTAAPRLRARSATASRSSMRPLLLMITATSQGRSTLAASACRRGSVTLALGTPKRRNLNCASSATTP
jgi:hypothetical protein